MVGIWCFIDTFLNTDDLNQLASSTLIGEYYLGCYAADIRPPNITENCCWIWNTDEDGKSGTHWIGVWRCKKDFIFFDSYGKNLSFYKREYWKSFAKELGCEFKLYSTVQRQSIISKTCSVWVLLFLFEQAQVEKKKISNLLAVTPAEHLDDLVVNEVALKNVAFKLFKEITKVYTSKCVKKRGIQGCCTYLTLVRKRQNGK